MPNRASIITAIRMMVIAASLFRLTGSLAIDTHGHAATGGRSAEQRDEIAAAFHRCNHSITSSAVASSVWGIVRPSAFAVLRLITSSNLVGCSIGRSAGLAPL